MEKASHKSKQMCPRSTSRLPQGYLAVKSRFKKRWIELAVKIAVAALTAFLTALDTTSCMRCMM